MARPRGSRNKATVLREAARNTAVKKAKIFGTDLPEVKLSLDMMSSKRRCAIFTSRL
jgi:hypothetical protein